MQIMKELPGRHGEKNEFGPQIIYYCSHCSNNYRFSSSHPSKKSSGAFHTKIYYFMDCNNFNSNCD